MSSDKIEEKKCCENTKCECTKCECTKSKDVVHEDDDDLLKEYADTLYIKLKESFPHETVTKSNLFSLIRIAMEEADRMNDLRGSQKKELVIRVVHVALEDYILDDLNSVEINFLVDNFVDLIIDNFVDIDFGNLHINESRKQKIRTFFKKLCPCMN